LTINYILLVHKNPAQVKELIRRLNHQQTCFYVHVDKNVDAEPFVQACSIFPNVAFLAAREKGTWGGIGIVKAALHALDRIIEERRSGYCILLSGQDLPLKSNEEILNFLSLANGAVFMDSFSLPNERWYGGGRNRIERYKFHFSENPGDYFLLPSLFEKEFYRYAKQNLLRVLVLLKQKQNPLCLLKKRRFPTYLKPFGGSQWWAMTVETAKRLRSFLQAHKDYLPYHRHTLLADEIFFQSVMEHLASAEGSFNIRPSLTYARWENASAAHPVVLKEEELPELAKQQGKLFARKFEATPVQQAISNILFSSNKAEE